MPVRDRLIGFLEVVSKIYLGDLCGISWRPLRLGFFLLSREQVKGFNRKGREELPTKATKVPAKTRLKPVPPVVRRVFHRLCAAPCALESDHDVESYRNFERWLESAGVFVVGREP
jgi:hypothetical protein